MSQKKPKRPLWQRLLIVLGVVYLLYVMLGFFLVPAVMKSVLEGRVAEQLDRNIVLEKAAFNPFTLSVELQGLTVEDDDREAFVELGRLFVNPQLFPLITKRVSVKEFALSDTIVRLALDEAGATNIDRLLESPESPEDDAPTEPMSFEIGLIDVANVRLELADYTRSLPLEETIGPVTFIAEDLRSDEDSDSPYSFNAQLGEETAIHWKGDISVNPVKSSGLFSIENVDISKAKPFWHDTLRAEIEGAFSIAGEYRVELSADKEEALLQSGSVKLERFVLQDPEEQTEAKLAQLSIDGIEARWPDMSVLVDSISVSEPSAVVVRDSSGSVLTPIREASAEGDQDEGDAMESESETLEIDALVKSVSIDSGTITVIDRTTSDDSGVSIGELSLSATNVAPFDDSQTAQLKLSLIVNESGRIAIDSESVIPEQKAKGSLSIEGLDLVSFQNYVALYSNAKIAAGQLNLDVGYDVSIPDERMDIDTSVGIASLEVHELDSGKPVFSAASMNIGNASYRSDGVSVDEVIIENPVVSVALDESGLSVSRLALPGESEEIEAEEEVESASTLPLELTVGRISIVDGKTEFLDETLSPAHQMSMVALNVDLEGISSQEGENASVSISTGFDRGGTVTFSGNLQPLDFKRFSDLKLAVNDFDLSATAPYWEKYLGRGLDKGMLNIDAAVGIEESLLDGTNGLLIDQLTLGEKVQSEDSLGLPIGLVVAMLKDRNGKMSFPPLTLKGDLDDPNTNIVQIILSTLFKLIIKLATSPFAALGGLAGGSGNEDLSTTAFETGQFALSPGVQSQLDKIAKILDERPALKVDLSSTIAARGETDALRRALISNEGASDLSIRADSSNPIALLEAYDSSQYEDRAVSIYRELMGIPLVTDAAAEDEKLEPTVNEIESSDAVEPSSEKKGVIKNVATFLKNVTGGKKAENADVEEVPEPTQESASTEAPELEPTIVLPPFSEIEAALFADDSFQVDPSWLKRLSEERAKNVKDYLVATKGIDASRVFISGESTEGNSGNRSAVKFELTD